MLHESTVAFFKRLLDTPGPSGFETRAARVWRDEASTFAQVRGDVAGNSIATVNPEGARTIMLAGHIDEIGVIITYIDDDGFVSISGIGGWDPQVLVGQRIRFMGADGDVFGVVGKKPIHLMKPADREKASTMTDLWVDVGATTRAEATERLSIGDAGVVDTRVLDLPNNRIASRAIDNRVGAFVVLEALRRYAAQPGSAKVIAVATTQEEIAWRGGGALVGANGIEPEMAIVVDVTFATDHPGIDKKELGEHKLGGGPVLSKGSIIHPVALGLLREAAERTQTPYTLHAAPRDTATDADAIHIARAGVATALVSVPNRYMHSPNEIVSLDDLDAAATLIAEACRLVSDATDFTNRG